MLCLFFCKANTSPGAGLVWFWESQRDSRGLPLREETRPAAEYCTKQCSVVLSRKTHLCAYLPGPFVRGPSVWVPCVSRWAVTVSALGARRQRCALCSRSQSSSCCLEKADVEHEHVCDASELSVEFSKENTISLSRLEFLEGRFHLSH